jgi:hypothetical protein
MTGWVSGTYSFTIKANATLKASPSITDDHVLHEYHFTAAADGSGNIALLFESVSTFALVNAIVITT